jgi:Rhodopirellula transposase DDE domain
MHDVPSIQAKFEALRPYLDERRRRLWAAAEAMVLGRGGITAVASATGLERNTIRAGVRELQASPTPSREAQAEAGAAEDRVRRVRAVGGGRKPLTTEDPALVHDLEALVEPTTRGDPMSPLRWTCKSTRQLAAELVRQGHRISHQTVADLLHALDYSLQGTRKTREGADHPDRDAQFAYINEQTRAFQQRGQPAISVDCKKKERVGDFKNGGREWQPTGHAEQVRVHDFLDRQLGKAIPYGVYDIAANQGWVSVGVDHETAAFAVASVRHWWEQMGRPLYPTATELLITADSGGSNGSHTRLWKTELQRFADETGLRVNVCHLPPGTSKWNVIEHRLFCQITQNWRGRPLVSLEVIVNLIGNTTTRTGLKVRAELDPAPYPTGIKVSDAEFAAVQLQPATFHGDWNYSITPHQNDQVIF